MKRLRLIAMNQDRDALLKSLLHAGCVEISEPEAYLEDEAWSALLQRGDGDPGEARALQTELKQAADVLAKYAPQKSGMFTARDEIRERELMDRGPLDKALRTARTINGHAKEMGLLAARAARLQADQLALRPWESCTVPLELKGTRTVRVLLGTVPNTVDFNAMCGAAAEAAECVEITKLSEDREQQYLEVLVHKDAEQAVLEALRAWGFAFSQLKELTGTAAENLRRLDDEIRQAERQREKELEGIRSLASSRKELEVCIDRVEQELATESAKERLLTGGSILYLDGWTPAEDTGKLEKALAGFDCAWELSEPAPEDYPQVPIKLKNNIFTRCMNTVTEMYSLPAYDGVDPNPLMAPFFIIFFGFMMNDIAYGLLMVLGTAIFLSKARPKGTMRYMMTMFLMCGVTSIFWGCLTGGFFGDFLPKLFDLLGVAASMPGYHDASGAFVWFWKPLFTPVNDIITVMVGSIAMGVVQVFTGMAVSVEEKFRHGSALDAVTQEIAWYCILGGAALAIAGNLLAGLPPVLGTTGIAILVLGLALLLVGNLIRAKGLGGIIGFGGDIYNGVSGYFSDILSYLRLMALMMAGSIIATVFNTLGSVFGLVPFLIVSLFGNVLNLVLNLLGCYVHTLRLQCLEFFGRFYQDGGKLFRPLTVETKYVDILKEEI